MSKRQTWVVVAIFAMAMAWLETAVVIYLRMLVNRLDPYQSNPLPMFGGLGEIECLREAATLVMLLTVGALAGKTWRSRLAYTFIAFGVWDIFYYIFLVPATHWPRSIFDWDILFLIPLPWWGPVLAPVLIASLMIIGGTLVAQIDEPNTPFVPRRWAMAVALVGALLVLYVFMADTLRVASEGGAAIRAVLPATFNWSLFIIALGLMGTPIIDMLWRLKRKVRRTLSMRRTLVRD